MDELVSSEFESRRAKNMPLVDSESALLVFATDIFFLVGFQYFLSLARSLARARVYVSFTSI